MNACPGYEAVAGTDVVLFGIGYETASVDMRGQIGRAVAAGRKSLVEAIVPGLASEIVVISTCNRVEICCIPTGSVADLERGVISWLAEEADLSTGELDSVAYRKTGRDAIVHLFRVACGLDSQMLGETQVLGQISQAFSVARSDGTVGPLLTYVLSRAVHTGKRARTETGISHGKTSISRAAAALVATGLGGLAGKTVILIGAGETAILVLEALREIGSPRVLCVNRSTAHALPVGEEPDVEMLPWSALGGALVQADAAVSATAASHAILRVEDVRPVLEQRGGRSLLLVDIAVPRDFDRPVGELPGIALYDIDHLEASLDEERSTRVAAVSRVEAIVHEETDALLEWLHDRRVAPLIRQFRERAMAIAAREARRTLGRLDTLGAREQDAVLQLARQVASKVLHEPTLHLKSLAREGDGAQSIEILMEVFGLDRDAGRLPRSDALPVSRLGGHSETTHESEAE
ncbi:MAG: glutamyl-tRNA reductase [Thermoleophilia bacterium]|nr:glutamyl-tRNA reductase [Thermoleophilia bacterium]